MSLLCLLFCQLVFSSAANADGGGPILLIANTFIFSVGQVWILGSEYFYLRKKISTNGGKLFGWIVVANVFSTLLGAILLPALWAVVTMGLSLATRSEENISGAMFALGTWVGGDNSPYPALAIGVSALGFVATFFPTVMIESRVYRFFVSRDRESSVLTVSDRAVWMANVISYLGLGAILALYILISEL